MTRSTFLDWAGDCTDSPRSVTKVEAAYRRGDGFQKRQLLAEEWAKFCAKNEADPGDAEDGGKIVALRRRRAKAA